MIAGRNKSDALFLLVRGSLQPHATVRDDEKRQCGLIEAVIVPQLAGAVTALAKVSDGKTIA